MCRYCNSKVIEDIVKQYQTSTCKFTKASCLQQLFDISINVEDYIDDCGELYQIYYLMANGYYVSYYHDDKTLNIVTTNKYFSYCPVCGRKLDSEG